LEGNAGPLALQLGFRQVDGFKQDWAEILATRRGNRFSSVDNLARRTELPKRALVILAEADCFQSLEQDRREALWAVRRLPDSEDLPLFAIQRVEEQEEENIDALPLMPLSEHVLADYQMLRFSLKAHLMRFLREMLDEEGVFSCHDVTGDMEDQNPKCKDGDHVICAGIVLTRQMPGDAGVVFVTLSDETGVTNVVVWPDLVKAFRAEIMGARLMVVEGKVQRSEEGVVHLVAERIFDRTHELDRLSEDYGTQHARKWKGRHVHRHPRNVRVVPKSRDFH
jgi:error-prone DNA polymerase